MLCIRELKNLMNLKEMCQDYFRRWYIDGKIYFHKVIDIDNPKDVPDTLNFYARNLQQFFGGDSRDNLLESLYHEPVHAAYLHRTEQGDDWGEERGYEQKSYGQKYFDVATNRMISDFEDKITRDGTLNAAEKENKMNQMIENIFNLSLYAFIIFSKMASE